MLELFIFSVIVFLLLPNVYAQILYDISLKGTIKQNPISYKNQEIRTQSEPLDTSSTLKDTSITINEDNNKVYVTNGEFNSISVFSVIRLNANEDSLLRGLSLSGVTSAKFNEGNSILQDNIHLENTPIAIAVNERTNMIYIGYEDSKNISVLSGDNYKMIEDIEIGGYPTNIVVNEYTNTVYVAKKDDSIAVISGENATKISDIWIGRGISDIAVDKVKNVVYATILDAEDLVTIKGVKHPSEFLRQDSFQKEEYLTVLNRTSLKQTPTAIAVSNNVYIASCSSDSISVISRANYTELTEIEKVGACPTDIVVNEYTNTIYTTHKDSDSISVISRNNYTKLTDIQVGNKPTNMVIDNKYGILYVVNSGSNSLSVIDILTNQVIAIISFKVNPLNSGYIECDENIVPTKKYFYIDYDTECTAKPNRGFEFLSWEENLQDNSSQIINFSKSASILESIMNIFNITSEEPEAKLKITKFGSFTANFKELPPPLPPEYVATLFGVVVTAFVSSWLTPTIIEWRKDKKHQNKLNDYQNELKDLHKNNKLDKRDIDNLDRLREKFTTGYTKGDITKDQYDVLLKNLSINYNEIFKNEINSSKNEINNENTIKLMNELDAKLDDVYLQEKIDKEHYDLLKEMISELEKKNYSNRK